MSARPTNVTALLNAWSTGDQAAGNELIETIYRELRRLAASYLKSERPDHTLQPTALVHELYLQLVSDQPPEWQGRGHFLAVAARHLRHILIDYARREQAQKRGGLYRKISLENAPDVAIATDIRVLDLDRALERLSELDSRSAQVVELKYFGGLTESEIAAALHISLATVKRDWEFGRAWLSKELH